MLSGGRLHRNGAGSCTSECFETLWSSAWWCHFLSQRGCVASFSRLSAEVWMSELRLLQARLHPAPFVSRDEKPANRLICDQDGVCLWHIGLPFTSDPRGRKFLFTSKDGLKISGYRFLFPHPSETWPDISWEEELENSDQITSSSTGFCKGMYFPLKVMLHTAELDDALVTHSLTTAHF